MNILLEQALKLPIPELRRLAADIYDSIDAAPEAVCLTPEQGAELERRIEYNRLHPDDVVPWEEVRERLASQSMILSIKFLDAAEVEASEAIEWYEERETGLGTALRESVEAAISSVQENPLAFPVVHGSNVRKAKVQGFPYTISLLFRPTAY